MKTDNSDNSQLVPPTTSAVIASGNTPLPLWQPVRPLANIPASISSVPSHPVQPIHYLTDLNQPSTSSASCARFEPPLPMEIHSILPGQIHYVPPTVSIIPTIGVDFSQHRFGSLDIPSSSSPQELATPRPVNAAAALKIFERACQEEQQPTKPVIVPPPTHDQKSFIRYITQATPDIAERILDGTGLFYKRSLENLIGKKNVDNYDRLIIDKALSHLMVKENIPEHNRFMTEIASSELLSQPDKVRLIRTHTETVLTRRHATGPQWAEKTKTFTHQDFVNSLNIDFIEILSYFGATEAQVADYVYFKKITQHIINRNAVGMTEDSIEDNIMPVDDDDVIILTDMQNCSTNFQRWLDRIYPHLDPHLPISNENILWVLTYPDSDDNDEWDPEEMAALPGGVAEAIAPPVDPEHEMVMSAIRVLHLNYLRGAPLLSFFKQVLHHNPILMRRSIANPEQRALMMAHHLHHYNRILDREDCLRALAFVTVTPILYFVLGDDSPEVIADPQQHYYGRGSLPFSQIFEWITDHRISLNRLINIGIYLNERLSEITLTRQVNIAWMNFDDLTLERLFANRDDLMSEAPQQHGMVLLEALNEIGKLLIGPNFDYPQLSVLLEQIRSRFANNCSYNDFCWLFFDDSLSSESSIPAIPKWIAETDPELNSRQQIIDGVVSRIRNFCAQVITKEAINALELQRKIIAEINYDQSKEKIYAFLAQSFGIPIILQNAEARFIKYYDAAGNEHRGAPAEYAGAALIRPGYYIQVAQNGELKATQPLRYHDYWSLLTTLIRLLKEGSGQPVTAKELDQMALNAGQQLLARQAPRHFTP